MAESTKHNNSDISIEVSNLVKKYRNADDEALRGISLSVNNGEFFGLLGPNAAGKTTMISVLCGLINVTGGDVFVRGVDVRKNPLKIRRIIGLVPQEIALYPAMTLKENITFFGQMYGLHGAELKRAVEQSLSIVRLEQHASKKISQCSGGIMRRANLVAGLIHGPELVFLDEPTVGVDAQSRNLIEEYVCELNKAGTTIVYTTHYMEEAETLCSRIVIIDNGMIIKDGSPRQLIDSEDCSNLGEVFLKLTGKQLRE